MRMPTEIELERWAQLARSSGNSAEGGRTFRLGGVDVVTFSDGLYLRLLTPLPALWYVNEPESIDQPAMFERTPEGEIVFHIGGLTDVFKGCREMPMRPRRRGRLPSSCMFRSRSGNRIPSSSRRILIRSRSA